MSCNCKSPSDVQKFLKDNDVPFVDLRFTDPRGKWQHLTMCSDFIDDDAFAGVASALQLVRNLCRDRRGTEEVADTILHQIYADPI